MRRIKLRQVLMLTAAVIMVLMLVTGLVRMGTQIVAEKAKINNKYTRAILTGTKYEQIPEDHPVKNIHINWQKQYPFTDINSTTKEPTQPQATKYTEEKSSWLLQNAKRLAARPLDRLKKLVNRSKSKAINANKVFQDGKTQISNWYVENLLGYNNMVEVGRAYEVCVDWHLMNPERRVIELEDGVWTGIVPKDNIAEKVQAISELSGYLKQKNIKFCYIITPFKVDRYGDYAVNDRLDFTNQNADVMIASLRAQDIDTLDLREALHAWGKEQGLNYHDFFYRTDHHWRPETALMAAKVVGERLKEYGIPVDDSHYSLDSFDVEVLSDFFLGSYGKKITLAKTKPEDFIILHPNFPTLINFVLPQGEIDITGPLDKVAYERYCISRKDLYRMNPYAMYGYGDKEVIKMENLLLPATNKKILIVKDSFGDTLVPMLATGVRNMTILDLRHFKASLHSYIEKNRPDVVIVLYNAAHSGPIDWKSHTNVFDFR